MHNNRNAFFAENNMFQSWNPTPNLGIPTQGAMPFNPNMNMSPQYPNTYPSEPQGNFETKFAKIERDLLKLEARVKKLENTNVVNPNYANTDIETNISNSMYMI